MSLAQKIPLEKLVKIIGGGTPSTSVPEYFNGNIPWVTPKDMKQWLISDSIDHISNDAVANSAAKIIPSHAVLVVLRSGVLKHTLPVGINIKPVTLNQDMKALVCGDDLYPTYLARFLKFKEQFLLRKIRGTTADNLPLDSLKSLEIPLLPIAEQRRIAVILDRADAVRRKRQEAIALTEELLRSTFLEMFGDPVKNPKGWTIVALGTLLTDIESGWSPPCDSREAEAEEWGVLKLGAITRGHFDATQNKALFPDTPPRPEFEVKAGDLLITRKNTYELVGTSTFVYTTRAKLMLPDLIFRLCPTKEIDSVYLWQVLSQKSMRLQLSKLASGTSGSMPNISKARLRTLCVPLPPLVKQIKYRDFVLKFWRQQKNQNTTFQFTDDLFNSLLQKAFRGIL